LSAPDKDSLTFASYGTQSAMRDLVLLERQRELMFEGKRWFDLVRKARREGTNGPMLDLAKRKYTKPEAVKSKWIKPDMLYLPIYEEELKVNTLLKQNQVVFSLRLMRDIQITHMKIEKFMAD
jgi:hypothetical protein